MKLGLQARLVGAVVLILVALLVSIAALVVVRAEQALADVDRARFAATTRQLAAQAGYGVLAEKPALLAPALDAFAASPDLVEVVVKTADGRALASRRGAAENDRAPVVRVAETVSTRGGFVDEDGELAAFGLQAAGPTDVGVVEAAFSTAATARVQDRVRKEIVVWFLLLGALGTALVGLLASSVVRRVRAIAAAASRVAAGDVDVRVAGRGGDDELGALAADFDAMTASLKAQRAQLDDAAAALAEREALAAIGRATAVLAHELRNPLGILLGAAEIVGAPGRPEEQKRKAAAIVVAETQRLSTSLDGLLSYARPRAPATKPVSARALARGVAERAALPGGPAEGKAIAVDGADARLLVDEELVAGALWNLVQNAAQAGAASITVAVERGRPGFARVVVDDDGPGIAPDVAERVFQPFTTTKQRGAGLGLAAARRTARDHGGDLLLERARPGARFVLELPTEDR
jgi:two-component system, NtrC family, sensor histidine kinase HydH